jgi:hypothetical protein
MYICLATDVVRRGLNGGKVSIGRTAGVFMDLWGSGDAGEREAKWRKVSIGTDSGGVDCLMDLSGDPAVLETRVLAAGTP